MLNGLTGWAMTTPVETEDTTNTRDERAFVTTEQLAAAAGTFDLLSVPGRLHLAWLLAQQEYDVTTLAGLTGAAIPATSQQLAKLRAAGVVAARREGRRQLYRIDDPHIRRLLQTIFEHIAVDGTLTQNPDPRRPPRRPRFTVTPRT